MCTWKEQYIGMLAARSFKHPFVRDEIQCSEYSFLQVNYESITRRVQLIHVRLMKPTSVSRGSTSSGSISTHFCSALSKKQIKELENQAIWFALAAKISFNAVADPELLKLLKLCNPSATLPRWMTFLNTVLEPLSSTECQVFLLSTEEVHFYLFV